MMETTSQVNLYLENREIRASLVLAYKIFISFVHILGVTQKWDLWVVTPGINAILGPSWLKSVSTAID